MVMSIMINATWHDTYGFGLIYYGTCESLAAPPPEIQRLVVRAAYNQDAKTYAPQTTRIWGQIV